MELSQSYKERIKKLVHVRQNRSEVRQSTLPYLLFSSERYLSVFPNRWNESSSSSETLFDLMSSSRSRCMRERAADGISLMLLFPSCSHSNFSAKSKPCHGVLHFDIQMKTKEAACSPYHPDQRTPCCQCVQVGWIRYLMNSSVGDSWRLSAPTQWFDCNPASMCPSW